MTRRAIFLILLLYTYTSTLLAETRLLQLGLEHWPPYVDRYHPQQGVAAELVVTALQRAGYQVNGKFDNWSSTLQGTGIGVLDVIVAGWYTELRSRIFNYSEPYLYNRISFIKRKDTNFSFNSFDDLRGVLIGTVSEYAYGEEFDKSNLLIKLPSNHVIQNLSLLQQGKIDMTLDDELVLRHELQTYMPGTLSQFEFLDKPLTTRGLHILVSRTRADHGDIIAAFNQALQEMKDDGSYEQIISKYENGLRFLKQPE